MSVPTIFLILLGIAFAAGCKYIINLAMGGGDIRNDDRRFQRMIHTVIDFASPVGNPEKNLATIFSVGDSEPVRRHGAMAFSSTVGWRYGYAAFVLFLIGFAVHLEATSGPEGYASAMTYAFFAAVLAWGGAYMWTFCVTVDGDRLSSTTGFLITRHFDLSQLRSVRKTRDGYRLNFGFMQSVSVPFFLNGHDVLRDLLIKRLNDNGR